MSAIKSRSTAAVDPADDEDAWAVVDEMEGRPAPKTDVPKASREPLRPTWLPKGMDPVLEELPKWDLLADVLHEIEQEMMRLESQMKSRMYFVRAVVIISYSPIFVSRGARDEHGAHHGIVQSGV